MKIKKFGKTYEMIEENNKTEFVLIDESDNDKIDENFTYLEERFLIDEKASIPDEERKDALNAMRAMKYAKRFTYSKYRTDASDNQHLIGHDDYLENMKIDNPDIEILDNRLIKVLCKSKSFTIDLDEVSDSHIWLSTNPSSVEDEDGKQKYHIEVSFTTVKKDVICNMYITGCYEK